ncbi:MAG: HEAT repeat domain-containing protein, partial [Phycisphaerae bacterium]|nr:HEAT repeat domain-containing protein [Phycisphaerae bacterium]
MYHIKLSVLVLAAAVVLAVPAEPCEAASEEQVRKWIVQLGSSNEKTQLDAKKNLCQLPPEQITDPLIAALQSDAWEARAGAADVLAKIKAAKAVEPICKLLNDKVWTVRLRAAMSLGQLKDPRANKALAAALKDPDRVVSAAAMRALKNIGPLSTNMLVTAMTMANPAIRREAIVALHKRKAGGVYKHYLKALGDKDASVRKATLYAIAYPPIADSKAVAPLVKLLEDKGDTPQRAAKLLGVIGDKVAVEPLRRTMWNHRSVFVRHAATEALVRLEAEKMVPTLIELLGRQKDTRITTLPMLRRFCDRRACKAILEVLSDDKKRVRSQAVAILGCLGDTSAVGPLIKLLENDPEPGVRLAAAKALGQLGDERAIDPLIRAITHPKYHIRQAAVTSLGVIGGEKVFQTLINATKNHDAKVRARAVDMLGETGDKRAYKSLLAALGDKDYYVICTAVKAMKTMGDEQAIEPMRRILRTRRGG